jgi:hypothetical protein
VSVFVQWVLTYITGQRGCRLIVNHYGATRTKPLPAQASPELTVSKK